MDRIVSMIIRYLCIFCLSFNSLYLLYFIFSTLTVYPAYFVFHHAYNATLEGATIIIGDNFINIAASCIAASAYFLLFVLNFSTPGIMIGKRILILFLNFFIFLIINLLRIFILAALFLKEFAYFTETHVITWHLTSAIFVILIWITTVKVFGIKEIPFYSDFIYLKNLIQKKTT